MARGSVEGGLTPASPRSTVTRESPPPFRRRGPLAWVGADRSFGTLASTSDVIERTRANADPDTRNLRWGWSGINLVGFALVLRT